MQTIDKFGTGYLKPILESMKEPNIFFSFVPNSPAVNTAKYSSFFAFSQAMAFALLFSFFTKFIFLHYLECGVGIPHERIAKRLGANQKSTSNCSGEKAVLPNLLKADLS